MSNFPVLKRISEILGPDAFQILYRHAFRVCTGSEFPLRGHWKQNEISKTIQHGWPTTCTPKIIQSAHIYSNNKHSILPSAIINGEMIVDKGFFTTIDVDALVDEHNNRSRRICEICKASEKAAATLVV